MFDYIARYHVPAVKAAERAFYLRSIRQYRFWPTVLAPVFFFLFAAACELTGTSRWITAPIALFFVLSVAGPVFFYFVRPMTQAKLAREGLERPVHLSSDGLRMFCRGADRDLPWTTFRDVWESHGYLALVINPFANVLLQIHGLPDGARALMETAIRQPTAPATQAA